MTISVNYQKRKNNPLFTKFQNNKHINLSNIQNYIPIYDRFFSLNHNNWNSINLNHQWSITDIKDSKKKEDQEHIFNCTLKNTTDDDDLTTSQPVFIKMAPLLDPFKYVVGKYNHTDPLLFNLPSFENTTNVHPKISDPNNSSFVDGFFSFLTSKILHEHKFIHGVDYYGSFLAIKNNYKINIMDDIDYLIQSEFFNNQKDVLFTVEDYSHLISQIDKTPLKPLHISSSVKSTLSAKSIDDSIFENIFVNDIQPISLDDVKKNGYELLDITESSYFDIEKQDKTETLNSGSSVSSTSSALPSFVRVKSNSVLCISASSEFRRGSTTKVFRPPSPFSSHFRPPGLHQCHFVTTSLRHHATSSPHHFVTTSLRHHVTSSPWRPQLQALTALLAPFRGGAFV